VSRRRHPLPFSNTLPIITPAGVWRRPDRLFPNCPVLPHTFRTAAWVATNRLIKRFAMRVENLAPAASPAGDYRLSKKPICLMEAAHQDAQPSTMITAHSATRDWKTTTTPACSAERHARKHLGQTAGLERHRSDYPARGRRQEHCPHLIQAAIFFNIVRTPRATGTTCWFGLSLQPRRPKQPHGAESSPVTQRRSTDSDGLLPRALPQTKFTRHALGLLPFPGPPAESPQNQSIGPARTAVRHRTPQAKNPLATNTAASSGVSLGRERSGQRSNQLPGLRVSSSWAGNSYAAIAIPESVWQVLITFLEGDPDQPLVTGCLYHKTHPVPYELPAHKTRSVFKTLSTAAGGGGRMAQRTAHRGTEGRRADLCARGARTDEYIRNMTRKFRVPVNDAMIAFEANQLHGMNLAEEHHTTHGDRKDRDRRLMISDR